ncbi:MAG: MarC-family protein, partial [Chlamydiia bacterium]|nr:MarC-family protein [Chlamydiia bacterium]
LSTIMILAESQQNTPKLMAATMIAWTAVIAIVVSAAYLQKILGRRGLIAMEQLMGMMLAMLSVQLLVNGATKFTQVLYP